MKQFSIVLLALLLFLIVGSFYYFKGKNQTLLSDNQIIDAIHIPKINTLFEEADSAKYAQDYIKADSEFRQLLKGKITTADSQYVLNQLAYINLTMNEDSVGYQWISQLEISKHPLSIEAQTDYNYNIGTWAYILLSLKWQSNISKKLWRVMKKYMASIISARLCA